MKFKELLPFILTSEKNSLKSAYVYRSSDNIFRILEFNRVDNKKFIQEQINSFNENEVVSIYPVETGCLRIVLK